MINYLQKIKEGKYTLIVRKGNRTVFKSNDPGIKGLVVAAKKGFLKKAIIFDKTIGLAAAKIAVYSGAKVLHALLASKSAVAFCREQKIPLKTERVVEKIYDFQNQNGCYLEKLARKIDNIFDLIKLFDNFYGN